MHWKLFADLAERAGTDEVSVDPGPDATVGDALDALLAEHPDLEERVLDSDGSVRGNINVLQNGTNVITQREGLATPTEDDDELALFPPVSGG